MIRPKSKIRHILLFLGILSILAGLGIILGGIFYVHPKSKALATSAISGLELAEGALGIAIENVDLLKTGAGLGEVSLEAIGPLPETLLSVQGTLEQSATAIETSARTLDALESGLSGVLLPSPEMGRNARAVTKAAEQLRLLAGMVGEMKKESRQVMVERRAILSEMRELNGQIPEIYSMLTNAQTQARELRVAVGGMPLSTGLLAGLLFSGGLYCFIGALFLALAGIYERLLSMDVSSSAAARPERSASKVA